MIDEILPEALAGERLDRVVSMLDGCSRSVAAGLIAGGAVQLDDAVIAQRSFRVSAGMRIRFESIPVEAAAVTADPQVEFEVVHADDDIVVVNKPAGLVVHPGAGRPLATLANGLLARFPEVADVGDPQRPGIVHRLDAETTGLLVVARSPQAYSALVDMLSRHDVHRVYAAIVAGRVDDDSGVVDAPIGRSTRQRTRMAVVADGRPARTHYEVLARAEDGPTSWLRCVLETGRTHQIRVHLSAIGHPVLGDTTYGPRPASPYIDRVALHAHRLSFGHPTSGEQVEFEAPLPADFSAALASLGLSQ